MTDVRISVSLEAKQARAEAQGFKADYKALAEQLQKPLGQASALRQVQTSAATATGAIQTLNSTTGRQQTLMAGLAAVQGRVSAAIRRLAGEQRMLSREATQATQAITEQTRAAAAQAAVANRLGARIGGVIGTYAGLQSVASIARIADAYNLMNARLKLATGTQEEFNVAQQELGRLAIATSAPVESLITLYGRISRPLKEAGRSQSDILQLTEAVATSFRVSGATAAEAQNGIIQFAQALGAGALRGDEFNSVAEQAPRLMTALAAGLGVSVSALRSMAAEGQLTADVVTDALIGQLGALREEAASLPDTVGSALTRLSDQVNQTIGRTDVTPLIVAIDQLGATLSDPVIAENIATLTGGLVGVAAAAANAASEFADLGKRAGYFAAAISGNVTDLDRIEQEIRDIQRSLDGWTLNDLIYSDDELRARLATLQAEKARIIREQSGLSQEQQQVQEQANTAAETLEKARAEALRTHAKELKKARDQLVEDAKTAINAEQKAERDAIKALERIKQDRLKLEETFNQSIARTRSGGNADIEPSVMGAVSLKARSRQSLVDGDSRAAIEQAQQALQILEQLEAAGANTYGFAGFKAELRDLALAAKDLEQTEAETKIAEIGTKLADLGQQVADLEKVDVTPTLSQEAADAVTAQLKALAETLGQTLVIPVQLVPQGAEQATGGKTAQTPTPPGFATGGLIHGPGSGTSDSILARLSNGEFVLRAAAVRHYGPELLEQLNGLRLPKFAVGGLVRERLMPSIPTAGPGLLAAASPQPATLGTVHLTIGNERLPPLQATEEAFGEVLARARMKFGRVGS